MQDLNLTKLNEMWLRVKRYEYTEDAKSLSVVDGSILVADIGIKAYKHISKHCHAIDIGNDSDLHFNSGMDYFDENGELIEGYIDIEELEEDL